jgi:predicted esterase
MQEFTTHFNFNARYYALGTLTGQTKHVWFVLHGYGQLARYFLQKFEVLQQKGIYVVAPEGLSRFYLEDVTKRAITGNNRVGATWMTAENRLMDIDNYLTYLQQIYTEVIGTKKCTVSLLGFSQGAATASRWALRHPHNFKRLILWAGIFPPDMDFDKGKQILADKEITMVYGEHDPYVTDERLNEMTNLANRLQVTPNVITFPGGHEIDSQTLEKLG